MGAGYTLHMRSLASTDTIFPNVTVAGVNVGGMTPEEATQAIHNAVDGRYEASTLLIKLPDRTLELTPELTHVSVDVEAIVDLAWNYGRKGNFWERAKAYQKAAGGSYVIDIDDAVTLDTSAVRTLIDQTAAEVGRSLVRTEVNINKTAGTITITQGTPGRSLDADALYAAVLQAYANNDFTTITMDYIEQEPDAVNLLSIYDQYCTDPVDASYDEKTGEITKGENGFGFDFEKENTAVSKLQPGETYTIHMEIREPKVTEAMLEGELFQDVLYAYSSYYVWNPARTENLTLACKEIDGTILAPGEVFSFNDTVGERTAARGFQPASVYVGVETQDELGGGVCQVASTLYYACLMANLEIVERTEHRYLVTYVDPGMDATIYWDSKLDFKFRNNTGAPLKINANTDDGSVNITLLGTDTTGEYVKMTYTILSQTPYEDTIKVDLTKGPEYEEVTQSPYTGYTVQTYRNVYSKDGELISTTKEAFSTYYERDRIITVGYGNPRIPEDYEYPAGTVFPELPEPDPEPGTDERPGETDPTEPTEPTDPTDPTTPTDPTEPTDPTTPTDPDPVEPTDPTEPTDPGIAGDG